MIQSVQEISNALSRNRQVFGALLLHQSEALYRWRPAPGKWNLLEIACHLLDEERFDFKARIRRIFEDVTLPFEPIDPPGWVISRNYAGQDYGTVVKELMEERKASETWLKSLRRAPWDNSHPHPTLGDMSARKLLHNWLAHDYLHIRQINRLLYARLQYLDEIDLSYAGDW